MSAHSHDHPFGGTSTRGRLLVVLGLTAAYMLAEIAGGLVANSLALLADAGHMFSDVAAIGLSLLAMHAARRPAGGTHTYGYRRAEILAALANGATLVAIAVYTVIEASRRFGAPSEVNGALMLAVAAGGLVVTLVGMRVLDAGRKESLNVRGVWLHVMTDAVGSVGVIVTGLLVWGFGWNWADLVASGLIALLILWSAGMLLRDVWHVLMEAAPRGFAVQQVQEAIEGLDDVRSVHELHVWTITSGLVSLSCHVVAGASAPQEKVLGAVSGLLRERFDIEHATVQVEPEDCGQDRCETVRS
jgi:cobalt-zinc-cadmium efflux system protein